MPRYRTGPPHSIVDLFGGSRLSQTYDLPRSRLTDGNSRIATYARSRDYLPLQARDMEPNDMGTFEAIPAAEWPSPPSPNLAFATDTFWSRFLERYYHPVADNHIQGAVAPNGETISPVSVGGGVCSNPTDYIAAPAGSVITLSGAGSSDADMPPNPKPAYIFTPVSLSAAETTDLPASISPMY